MHDRRATEVIGGSKGKRDERFGCSQGITDRLLSAFNLFFRKWLICHGQPALFD
jgi:hypothetical protein